VFYFAHINIYKNIYIHIDTYLNYCLKYPEGRKKLIKEQPHKESKNKNKNKKTATHNSRSLGKGLGDEDYEDCQDVPQGPCISSFNVFSSHPNTFPGLCSSDFRHWLHHSLAVGLGR